MARVTRDEDICRILSESKVVAIVGLSDDPERPSRRVARYLKGNGYRIVPVNPRIESALGQKAYASLREVPDKVDVFRRSEHVPEVVEDAVAIGAKVIWLKEGVVSEAAAARAAAAGLEVVMDRCMAKDHHRLIGEAGH